MVSVNDASRRGIKARNSSRRTAVGILLVGACFLLILFMYALWDGHHHAKEHLSRMEAELKSSLRMPNSIPSHSAKIEKGSDSDRVTIGYAVSVTGCGSDPISEGAAVLKHSVHLASQQSGKYGYKFYAIVHPDAMACGAILSDLGYEILERDTPVAVKDIQGKYLREKITSNGCCGEKELIKLEAYTLTQHPIVVHLDLDTLVLKPMDALFDVMMGQGPRSDFPAMWANAQPPKSVDALFTRDYNMVNPGTKYKPVQGGFLALKPSMEVYKEFVEIVREGDFRGGSGWKGEVGPFYGSMTFQGLIPLFYDYLHPGTAVEMNRCIINQMCDNPRTGRTINDVLSGDCRTGEKDCEDCRARPLEDVVTVHFTLCQKPWHCNPQDDDRIQERLCRKLHHEWFRIRSDLEQTWGRSGKGPGGWNAKQDEHYFGYCSKNRDKGYVQIARPYGKS